MNTEIVVCIISLIGTVIGSLTGVVTSSRLTTYRISQLEIKVEKHNNLIERIYNLEREIAVQDEKIKDIEEAVK